MQKSEKPRLNPFVFPTATDFRFILLIVCVLGASLFVFKWLYFSEFGNQYTTSLLPCLDIRPNLNFNDLNSFINPEIIAAQAAWERCRAPAELALAKWALSGLVILSAISGIIFLSFPARIIRRKKLVQLSAEDAPDVLNYLLDLCREIGVSRHPKFYWNPLDSSVGGLAFGKKSQYKIALSGGLITRFYTDRATFRAIVLHELGHIYNSDIDKTYLAESIWQAFLITSLPTFIFGLIIDKDFSLILPLSLWVIALILLVYLVRNGILRVRETYADVRASFWDQTKEALLKLLNVPPKRKVPGWRNALSVHPDPITRSRAINDNSSLFPMSFWEAFATSASATIALPTVLSILSSLFTGTGWSVYTPMLSGILFAPLAMWVVGVGIWRMSFAAYVRSEVLSGVGRLGLGLALGIVIGNFFSMESLLTFINAGSKLSFILVYVIWFGLLLLAATFVTWWIATSASAWVKVLITSHSPRHLMTIGLIIAGLIYALLIGMLFIFGDPTLLVSMLIITIKYWPMSLAENPITFMTLSVLWLFPLSSWFWQKKVSSIELREEWFSEEPPNPKDLQNDYLQSPKDAFIVGLISGFGYLLLILVIRIILRLILSEEVRANDQFILYFAIGNVVGAVLIQMIVAFTIAILTEKLGSIHGLYAAFSAGCVMSVGLLVENLLFGGSINFVFAWSAFSLIVNFGIMFAIPVVITATGLASRVRKIFKNQTLAVKGLAG